MFDLTWPSALEGENDEGHPSIMHSTITIFVGSAFKRSQIGMFLGVLYSYDFINRYVRVGVIL